VQNATVTFTEEGARMEAQSPNTVTTAAPPTPVPPQSRSKRWLALLLVLVGGVLALPTIIARTSLRHRLLTLARPELKPGGTIQSASLGWFSPVELRGVGCIDAPSGIELSIARLTTEHTLWQMVTSSHDLGRIKLEGLEARVPSGWSRRFGRSPAQSKTSASRDAATDGPRFRLEWTDCRLTWLDESGGPESTWHPVQGHFDTRRLENDALSLELVAEETTGGRGRAELRAAWQPAANRRGLVGPGQIVVSLEQAPIDPIRDVLAPLLGARALAGDLTATLNVEWEALDDRGGTAALALDVPAIDLAYVATGEPDAPRALGTRDLTFTWMGNYDGAADRLSTSVAEVHSEWGDGSVRGTISELRSTWNCNLAGELACDLSSQLDRLDPALRREVSIDGLALRQFQLRGPLRPAEEPAGESPAAAPESLRAEAEIVWDRASAYGVVSDEAQLVVDFSDNRLTLHPLNVPISGGRLVGAPALLFDDDITRVEFADGPLMEDVTFSPAMCRSWLRYVSPLLADATTIDGRFSLAMAAGTLSPAEPATSNISGVLTISESRVAPGPMAEEILGIIRQVRALARPRDAAPGDERTWLTIQNQEVAFATRDGRAYHDGLAALIGPVTVRSSGSVGLVDESLDILIEIELPESWLQDRPVLASLMQEGGLRIPVRGTLSRPQLEFRPLENLGTDLGARATEGILRRLLDQ
jgi:hypothetical protein